MRIPQKKPIPQIAEFVPIPVPHKGINAIASLAQMDPEEAIYAYNLIATQNGMQVRPGYSEWVTNLAGSGGVRTVIPVRGNDPGGANDKLFACTIQGIWDCTSSTSAPTKVVTFGTQTGNAGWGSWEHCTNAGGDVMLLYCDEVNGYYTFDTATTTWLQVTQGAGGTQINGVNPATFAFVRLHNNRVWFVQAGTGNAWFLPVGQVYGAATEFSFGNKFSHGGNLNSLWVFTYGSYFGTYLYLVGIGDAGDVIAYTGNDPTQSTTWSMAGQWYVGELPPGRRVASNYGGDLVILNTYGAITLSSLFYQKDLSDPNIYMTKKIAPAIKNEVNNPNAQVRGWEIVAWPNINSLLVLDPNLLYVNTYQFCYCLATNGWTVFRNFPMQTAAVWQKKLYAGTPDGRVVVSTGGLDNVKLSTGQGTSIQWGGLGAFNSVQAPGRLKFFDLIRPYFLTDQQLEYTIFARFDFNIADLILGQGVPAPPPIAGPVWDTGIWDSAIWGMGGTVPQLGVSGSSGQGRWCAVGILGTSNGNSTLISYESSIRVAKGFL